MRVCLFEDRGALDLEPLSLTRPVFELLCGLSSLAAKQSRFFPPGPRGVLVRPLLADLCRFQTPARTGQRSRLDASRTNHPDEWSLVAALHSPLH